MGLFGGLFDKKHCNFCGGEIGMLGNRKLEDGNMCKNCASKLSPWFSDRRHSTVAEIGMQLEDREINKMRVASFFATRTYGESFNKIFIDDNAQTFMVTSANNIQHNNPDVFSLDQVISCVPDINEHRHEIYYKDQEGHNVSYNPPRYRYEYDFRVKLCFNHPYVDDIWVNLNSGDIDAADAASCAYYVALTEDVVESMTGLRPDLRALAPYRPLPPMPPMHPHHPQPAPRPAPAPQPAPHHGPVPNHMGPAAPQPARPAAPQPARPVAPQPAQPARPAAPQPARPAAPQPARPAAPQPGRPAQPGQPAGPARPGQGPAGHPQGGPGPRRG